MTDLQIFNFNGTDIRTLTIDNEPYFVGKDVAKVLGYKNSRDTLMKHVDEEDKKDGVAIRDSIGRNQSAVAINESGLYSLILSSKLPTAKKFKHWVTSEVLPAIRKHGGYLTDEKIEEALYNPDTLIKLATQLKEEREGRLIAEQQVAELKPKASYLDEILANKELITVSVIAKDYGMSAMQFNKLLHNLKVQFKQGKSWLLYSNYQSLGWTSSSTKQVTKKDGSTMNVMNTKWTQKGRLGLYELLKRHDILPMIERAA
ncbi:phage antirepressor KilAC domain-containing protein [Lactobacillus mulieris]|jgi:prophage antirepressor|uniref:Repressor domain protein n=1 Tax=Siphoviridae sp. ctX581 TaxID=2826365 RepID=A0A8S5MDT1_9CAUD|nr:phage antirepressor [Lactobacillus mulieris]DAD80328.1 MAG TPA: repressor domain protein [Siphoviridae sp. ctX581]MCW8093493.1 phage antirepressor [Lactobacillus mulieris]MCZ3741135.1 phage antirepressor [Lactobacillus mulieris]MCZ3744854.1 phage antirepressor [Lactobacillus mulieris]MCZ3747973.1 phage antirepressor [Lactobacillus mulieris]